MVELMRWILLFSHHLSINLINNKMENNSPFYGIRRRSKYYLDVKLTKLKQFVHHWLRWKIEKASRIFNISIFYRISKTPFRNDIIKNGEFEFLSFLAEFFQYLQNFLILKRHSKCFINSRLKQINVMTSFINDI